MIVVIVVADDKNSMDVDNDASMDMDVDMDKQMNVDNQKKTYPRPNGANGHHQ